MPGPAPLRKCTEPPFSAGRWPAAWLCAPSTLADLGLKVSHASASTHCRLTAREKLRDGPQRKLGTCCVLTYCTIDLGLASTCCAPEPAPAATSTKKLVQPTTVFSFFAIPRRFFPYATSTCCGIPSLRVTTQAPPSLATGMKGEPIKASYNTSMTFRRCLRAVEM